jgi:hypothetical protein
MGGLVRRIGTEGAAHVVVMMRYVCNHVGSSITTTTGYDR